MNGVEASNQKSIGDTASDEGNPSDGKLLSAQDNDFADTGRRPHFNRSPMNSILKLPFLKFFPRDVLADTQLRLCSPASHGVWLYVFCLMLTSDRYGYLWHNGKPCTTEQAARIIGYPEQVVSSGLEELLSEGVFSQDENGIYCRRLLKDRERSEVLSKFGRKGYREKATKRDISEARSQKPEAIFQKPERLKPTLKPTLKPDNTLQHVEFEEVWKTYPKQKGKQSALKSYLKARNEGTTQEEIIAGIKRYIAFVTDEKKTGFNRQWQDGSTWFNAKGWLDENFVSAVSPAEDEYQRMLKGAL